MDGIGQVGGGTDAGEARPSLERLVGLSQVIPASAVCAALQEGLRAGIGLRLPVSLEGPRSLPRFELKARRVVRRPT